MSSNLTYSLGEVAEIYDGPHATPKKLEKGDAIFLSISSLNQGRLNIEQSSYISEEEFIKWTRRVTPQPGDVVFSYETKIGDASIIPVGLRCCLGRRMGLLRAKTDKVIPDYLLYAYLSPAFQEVIREKTIHGSTTDRLSIKEMPSFKIQLADINTQYEIVKILKAIDGKLQLNQQINKTLEQMAQALFKSWFVDFDPVKAKIAVLEAGGSQEEANLAAMTAISGKDFDSLIVFEKEHPERFAELKATAELFPYAMQESELVEIPEEWEISSLAEKILLIGGGTPKRSEPSFWDGNICWYSVKDAPNESDVFVIDTIEKITNDGLNKSSTKLLPVGTTIISARGTVGKLALTAIETAMNQSCYGISGGSFSGPFLTYLKVKQCIDALKRNTHGAVFDTITTNTFNAVNVLTAGKKINDRFEEIITPLFNTIKNNLSSNSSLAQLRDTLLPKLLSGDITLPEAEQTVSEATHV